MWGDSVPNGSLQWSISCLVCVCVKTCFLGLKTSDALLHVWSFLQVLLHLSLIFCSLCSCVRSRVARTSRLLPGMPSFATTFHCLLRNRPCLTTHGSPMLPRLKCENQMKSIQSLWITAPFNRIIGSICFRSLPLRCEPENSPRLVLPLSRAIAMAFSGPTVRSDKLRIRISCEAMAGLLSHLTEIASLSVNLFRAFAVCLLLIF